MPWSVTLALHLPKADQSVQPSASHGCLQSTSLPLSVLFPLLLWGHHWSHGAFIYFQQMCAGHVVCQGLCWALGSWRQDPDPPV